MMAQSYIKFIIRLFINFQAVLGCFVFSCFLYCCCRVCSWNSFKIAFLVVLHYNLNI